MTDLRLPVAHPTECQCLPGIGSVDFRAGHEMHLVQRRVAAATPSKWSDAVVTAVDGDGWVTVARMHDDRELRLWHHDDLREVLSAGDPVAVHELYHVLAIGGQWVNVLPQ